MSAITTISGLAGRGDRTGAPPARPPVDSERRMVARKSSGPFGRWRRRRASRTASLRVSGRRARLQGGELVPGGVHHVELLGEGLAQRPGPGPRRPGPRPAGAGSRPRPPDAGRRPGPLYSSPGQALLEAGSAALGRPRPGRGLRSGARAPGRGRGSAASGTGSRCPPRAGPARCRRTGSPLGGRAPASSARRPGAAPGSSSSASSSDDIPSPPPPPWPRLARSRVLARRGRVGGPGCLAAPSRTRGPCTRIHLEGRLERLPVAGRLHHVAAERVLERLAVLDRDVMDRFGRVEGLGERHRQPGGAQLLHEPREEVQHAPGLRARWPRGAPWPPCRCRLLGT